MKKVVTSYELVTLMIEAITNIRALIASIKSWQGWDENSPMLQNIPRTPICKVMKGCIQRLKDSKIIVIEIVPGGIERYAYHKVSEKRGLIKWRLGVLCNHREESGTFGRHKKSGNKIKPSELINLVTATVNLIITLVAIIIKLM